MGLTLVPLANIAITSDTLPHAIPMFNALYPFTIVRVSILPSVKAFTINAAICEVAKVLIPVAESLVTFAVAFVIYPLSFIYAAYLVNAYALAMAQAADCQLTSIEGRLVTLNVEQSTLL